MNYQRLEPVQLCPEPSAWQPASTLKTQSEERRLLRFVTWRLRHYTCHHESARVFPEALYTLWGPLSIYLVTRPLFGASHARMVVTGGAGLMSLCFKVRLAGLVCSSHCLAGCLLVSPSFCQLVAGQRHCSTMTELQAFHRRLHLTRMQLLIHRLLLSRRCGTSSSELVSVY